MTKSELKDLIKEALSEMTDYDKMTPQQKRQYEILRDLDWQYDYTENKDVYMTRWDRGSDSSSKLATMIIKPDGEHYRIKSTNENYEDGIKDAKDRMAYVALRKQEKDYIQKSKQSSSPIKKKHYMDMSKQVLDKALDILKKHKAIDEAEGFRIKPQPKSPLEGAVVSYVDNDGHYHADIILKTKEGREVKGRFEYHHGQFAF